ncbi:conserved hypothetical protein [uncultured Desulfobacterium sp.]|uniref:TonB-dependent receptor n=1 Tax=uncultured Desulfobacterium sp. TaxID=201089 RepID=A0A445N128_9BACT|nr:conserved hypothetical protein [uncultured Desulfobacterium sp.]
MINSGFSMFLLNLRYYTIFIFIFLACPDYSWSEQTDINLLGEIYVTATRTEKNPLYIPNAVYSISSKTLQDEKMSRTVPDSLKEIPGIMVQKTAYGQGSPYIRGFTGFRTLFLIDGIRLNNSVFRDGPNQYWNTVDPLSIDSIEIIKGPGSVLFGSDAVGGTVNALTVRPRYADKGYKTNGRLYGRCADAEDSYTARGEVGGTYEKDFGWILGYSYKDFGDIEGGDHVGKQPKTGYDEWDGDAKVEYRFNADSGLVLAHQHVDQDDAWRTHKTIYGGTWRGTTHGSEKSRVLGQDRDLTYVQYQGKNIGPIVDVLKLSLSYQNQQEVEERVKSNNSSDRQGLEVGTVGVLTQIDTQSPFGMWTYGMEYYRDAVDSFKKNYRADGSFSSSEIQGPVADDASYDLLGIFLQDDISLYDSFDLILGSRYTYSGVDANDVKDSVTGDKISISDHWDNLVGSIRAIYHLDQEDHYNIFAGVSQAFRAPNLSDLTRLDTARSNEIETPAPNLDPEEFITYEMGLKTGFQDFKSQVAYFYTDISKMIVRAPTGNIIDGDNEVTKKNSGDGYIHGVEIDARWRFHPEFVAFGSFAWMDGEVESYPTSDAKKEEEPVSRLMPITCHAGLRWEPKASCWMEGIVTIAAEQDNLSSSDKLDTDRIPPDGTPGYTVYGIRAGWDINESMSLSASVENLTDKDYRIHGSGLNEPGMNAIIAADYRF